MRTARLRLVLMKGGGGEGGRCCHLVPGFFLGGGGGGGGGLGEVLSPGPGGGGGREVGVITHLPSPRSWTDRHLWKHNLRSLRYAGGKNHTFPRNLFSQKQLQITTNLCE